MVPMEEDQYMYLFGWINALRARGPLRLLPGPRYRIKLLSLVFLWPQGIMVPMEEDSAMFLFGWINEMRDRGPLRLLSGSRYRIKLLSLVFLWPPWYNGSTGRRFIYASFRLNKRVGGQGPFKVTVWVHVGQSCCHWYFCDPESIMVPMEED